MQRYLTQRWLMAGVVIALLVLALAKPGVVRAVTQWPGSLVRVTVGWASLPLVRISNALRGRMDVTIDRGNPRMLEANYDALLRFNAQLNEELKHARAQLQALSSMKQWLEERPELGAVVAEATAWRSDPLRRTMDINLGASQGVRQGSIVVDWQGSDMHGGSLPSFALVGRVVNVGMRSATVEMIHSPGQELEVQLLPSTAVYPPREPARVRLKLDGKGYFSAVVKTSSPVTVGQLAHLSDPAWPSEARGFVVGKVVGVEPKPDDPYLFEVVKVEPIHDLDHMSRVIVLVPRNTERR